MTAPDYAALDIWVILTAAGIESSLAYATEQQAESMRQALVDGNALGDSIVRRYTDADKAAEVIAAAKIVCDDYGSYDPCEFTALKEFDARYAEWERARGEAKAQPPKVGSGMCICGHDGNFNSPDCPMHGSTR